MNRFIKIFSLTAFIAVASVASAQDGAVAKPGTDKALDMTNKLDRGVHLSEEQRAQVLDLASSYYTQVEILKRDKATFADKKKELDGKSTIQLKAILTAEQYAKYEEMINDYNSSNK